VLIFGSDQARRDGRIRRFVTGTVHEEAPGEDRGFVAEEESGIGMSRCDDLWL
jgi:hypothetical protein